MKGNPRVIIAGAGPVGLTAALLLGRKDIAVTVVEAESAISEELRASTFHPPTLDMLAPCGITERMLDAGLICPTWQIRMHPSGDRAVFDLAVLAGETDHPYRLQCEQSRYCQFVLAAIEPMPNVALLFSTPLTGLQQTADVVEVEVSSQFACAPRGRVGANQGDQRSDDLFGLNARFVMERGGSLAKTFL
jgi:2-polyprenyl-6-methoxyphenol hydroxylase-like FAD-dependent oxidoreductase